MAKYSIFVVIVFSSVPSISQTKIDSLEHLLTTQISADEKIKIEIDLVNEYFSIDQKKATKYLEILATEIEGFKNNEYLILYYYAKSIDARASGFYEEAKNAAKEALVYANNHKDSIKFKAKSISFL